MAKTTVHDEEPMEERLEQLIHIEDEAEEAAEAAAVATAHALEAKKAAEAAKLSRMAKATEPPKAAKKPKKSSSTDEATAPSAPLPKRSTKTRQKRGHVLELRLNDDEFEQIEKLAAEKGISADALARFLLVESLGRSDDD